MNEAFRTLLLLAAGYVYGFDAATEVTRADKAYRRAMDARDVPSLDSLLTSDFRFVRRTGEIWDRSAFLDNVKGSKLAAEVQEKDLETRVYGDAAILTHRDTLKFSDGHTVEMIATRVLVKQRGAWKLASVQDTALPAK